MRSRPSVAGAGLAVLALVVAVAGGALAVGVSTSGAAPEVLAPVQQVTAFPVTRTAFDDSRTVALAVDRDGPVELVSPGAGRVTAVTCRPGTPLVSGGSHLTVDGEATVSLATSVPLWRDLGAGDRGTDVTALQEELARLGHPVGATGTVDRGTLTALAALLTEAQGSPVTLTTVPMARVLWLPRATTEVESCAAGVASTVAPGDVVAVVPGALRSVALVEEPPGLVAGPRALVVDGTVVTMDPGTPITDEATLEQLAALPSLRPAGGELTSELTDAPSGRLRLAEPVDASVVPPSAVLVDTGDPALGCVVGDGTSLPVRLVGSQLGQTYVLFDTEAPGEVEVRPAPDLTCR